MIMSEKPIGIHTMRWINDLIIHFDQSIAVVAAGHIATSSESNLTPSSLRSRISGIVALGKAVVVDCVSLCYVVSVVMCWC